MAILSALEMKIDSLIKKMHFGKETTNNIKIGSIKLNSKTNVSPFLKDVKEIAEEQLNSYFNDDVFFTRIDIAEEVAKVINPPRKYKKIIDKLNGLVEQKDIGALLYASRICEGEDKGEIKDDIQIRKLVEAYKNRGSTLYNWLRSEDVFPLDIIPLIESKDQFPDVESFHSVFKMQWENLIKFHPWRIFVSIKYSDEELREEILRRVVFWKMHEVFLYSRRTRNKFASIVSKDCLNYIDRSYKIDSKQYKIGDAPALRLKIYCPKKI